MNLYCVMIPTHRNRKLKGGWFDFKWRRKFRRRHDETIRKNVAILHGGYTFLSRSEGGWMNGPNNFQVEGVRPFLFTAETQEKADIIADLVCIHYDQITVMMSVWAQDVQFRDKRELIPFFTNMLSANWTGRLRRELPVK
jgi:hypothetical protein